MAKQQSQRLNTEIRSTDPKSLKGRDRNARYMSAAEMDQLTNNIKNDGVLTSLPLVFVNDKGNLEILSGHHRTEAAIKAGLDEIDVIVITDDIPEERKIAIQLAHNAITGKDDVNILAELYNELDLDMRKYSGLTDDMVAEFDKIKLDGLAAPGIKYDELVMTFLPDDREAFNDLIERIEKSQKVSFLAAPSEQFEAMFDTIIRVKGFANVANGAVAMSIMVDLVNERLDELEAETDD